MKRSEQKELRRREILFKALELFAQKGYAGTKTSDIAKELGTSEGLIFHYFPTKEQLYLELVKIGVEGIEYFKEEIKDPYKAIYEVINDFFERAKESRLVAQMFVVVEDAQKKENTPPAVFEAATRVNIIEDSVPLIKLGQEQGVFRVGDPLALSYTFWSALQGIMEELARNSNMNVPEAEWLMAILKA